MEANALRALARQLARGSDDVQTEYKVRQSARDALENAAAALDVKDEVIEKLIGLVREAYGWGWAAVDDRCRLESTPEVAESAAAELEMAWNTSVPAVALAGLFVRWKGPI